MTFVCALSYSNILDYPEKMALTNTLAYLAKLDSNAEKANYINSKLKDLFQGLLANRFWIEKKRKKNKTIG